MRCADGPPPRVARWPTPLTTCCGPVPPPISDRRPEPGCLTRRPSRLATHGSVDAVRRAAPLISQHRRPISRLSGTHCRTGNRDHCAHDDTHPVVEKSPSVAGRPRPAANTLRRTSSSLRIRSQPCAPAAAGHPGHGVARAAPMAGDSLPPSCVSNLTWRQRPPRRRLHMRAGRLADRDEHGERDVGGPTSS